MIPYARQLIDDDDIQAVVDVLKGDWLTTGPAVQQFDSALAVRVQAKHALSCSSGTAALHMATAAAGLGPNDLAIVPTITFLATANAVKYTGADVIFADVDADTGLLTPDTLRDALSLVDPARVKAVLPVHMAGQCPDMDDIMDIAGQHKMTVIEDAAHAIGTTYISKSGVRSPVGSGTLGQMVAFSFHPAKTIAMAEGGAVTTNDDELAEKLELFRNHGMTRVPEAYLNKQAGFDADGSANPWYYEMHAPGYNYRASDLHCALGLSQLAKLDQFVARRAELTSAYDTAFNDFAPALIPLARTPFSQAAWHLYPVLIDFEDIDISRAHVMTALRDLGIGTQVHYIPVHTQPYYQQKSNSELTGAAAYYKRTLSLPLHANMSVDDVHTVVDALRQTLKI
jgi:UDP-4-amino-4,6-dideoxy-N-acetyl-beta-L-altrosamine transaminase